MPEEHSAKMDEQDTKLLLRVLLAVRKGDFVELLKSPIHFKTVTTVTEMMPQI